MNEMVRTQTNRPPGKISGVWLTAEHGRVVVLIAIMIAATVLVGGVAVGVLYQTAFEQQLEFLADASKSQARLMEAVARYDRTRQVELGGEPSPQVASELTISQIRDAHSRYKGYGETGEFTLGRRNGADIEFVLRHRHYDLDGPELARIPFSSRLAEPMRQALLGRSGTMVGADYRGVEVMAAFEPVAVLNLGVVSKVDLVEFRAPFVKAGGVVLGVVVFVVVVGTVLFLRVSDPIVHDIRDSESRIRLLLNSTSEAIFGVDLNGDCIFCNPATVRMLGYAETDDLLGANMHDKIHHTDANGAVNSHADSKILGTLRDGQSVHSDSEVFWRADNTSFLVEYWSHPIKEGQKIVGAVVTFLDITDRRKAERALRDSAERYAIAVSGTSDGLWDRNFQTGDYYISPRWKEMLGYEDHEIENRYAAFTDRIHPEDQNLVYITIREHLTHRRPYDIEFRMRCKSGDYIWVQSRGQAVWDEIGLPLRMAGAITDISERRRTEDRLRQLSQAVEQSPISVAITDLNGNAEYVNPKFKEVSGYDDSEIIGENLGIINSGLTRGSVYKDMWSTISAGQDWRGELQNRRKDNTLYWESVAISPITGPNGKVEHFVVVKEDISHRKAVAEELENAKNRADKANMAKTRFMAAASHDLRQPLHAIGLLMTVLRRNVRKKQNTQLIREISTSLSSLEEMFGHLLDTSKLDSDGVVADISDFPVSGIVERIAAEFRHLAAEVEIEFRMVPSSVVVKSDPILLERIIRNLLSNAISNTASGRILIGVKHRGEAVAIEIWDTGLGIPDDQLELIFEPYHQVTENKPGKTGLGLGLAIVYRLAEIMGHELKVRSTVGKGSVFSITVPKVNAPIQFPKSSAPRMDVIDCAGSFVAVIDDDPRVLSGTRTLLESWECRCVTGGTAADLMDNLAKDDLGAYPDIVIADYQLADGKFGPDEVGRLNQELGLDIPFMIVTGNIDEGLVDRAKAKGWEVLHKPLRPAKLRSKLSLMLRQSRAAANAS